MNDLRKVEKAEFDAFIAAYPRPLKKDVFGAFEPPLLTYNDFTLGNWPESVVASVMLAEESYIPGIPNEYRILAAKE